jgi:hypothetical protein
MMSLIPFIWVTLLSIHGVLPMPVWKIFDIDYYIFEHQDTICNSPLTKGFRFFTGCNCHVACIEGENQYCTLNFCYLSEEEGKNRLKEILEERDEFLRDLELHQQGELHFDDKK